MKYQGHFYLPRNCRTYNETQWKEQRSVQYEEITSYSFAEYISDLGGAAGLVLGQGFILMLLECPDFKKIFIGSWIGPWDAAKKRELFFKESFLFQ